jgi:hypothetical protein
MQKPQSIMDNTWEKIKMWGPNKRSISFFHLLFCITFLPTIMFSQPPRQTNAISPGPNFTLIGLPDIQYYTSRKNGGNPAILNSQIQWIVANMDPMNIVYVTQMGDCVDDGDLVESPWQVADEVLANLENPQTTNLPDGIPFGLTVGNHDQSPNGDTYGTTTYFNKYFGISRFLGRGYYGGHYGFNNDNHFDLFSASGMDFIVINLEYDPNYDALVRAWADSLLQIYNTRRAIIVSHYIIDLGNPPTFGTQGQALYMTFKDNSNVFLFLCAHREGEGRRSDTFDGHTIHSLLADYTNRPNGGNGWLRIMQFSPANNEIRVKTYSPWLDKWETDGNSQFTLYYDMQSNNPFHVPVDQTTKISSGTTSIVRPANSSQNRLISFGGIARDNTVKLAWEIGSGYIFHGFEVERSDDRKIFLSISFVKGVEDSLLNQTYEFIDKGLSDGNHFYRLKIWLPDGRFEYSQIVKVDVTASERFNLFQNSSPCNHFPQILMNRKEPVKKQPLMIAGISFGKGSQVRFIFANLLSKGIFLTRKIHLLKSDSSAS